MLDKINRISNWQAALIIAVVGFAVFGMGLTNAFQGDDLTQIVNNTPVHSISHIKLFFEGGTFDAGNGKLIGTYFRPLMTTVFSLLYTLFGPHPIYYHLFQLLLGIGSAFILYLFFKFSFKQSLALFLAIIFLVHPLNSQVVYAIPSMQDALFFFFGILGIYLLLRFKSMKSMMLAAACLLLALFAKETAALFILMALLYLFWWDKRDRLYQFIGIMVLPIVMWLVLRVHAVGLLGVNPHNAPIDSLSFAGRLMTAPSILLFYISKFIFPWKLASAYYFVHPTFSVRYVLLPLIVDICAVALILYVSLIIRRKASKAMYYTYLYFAIWSGLSLLLCLQIIRLDMTICETWFYFSMAGFIGMIGVVLSVFPIRLHANWLIVIAILLVSVLGLRTAIRGLDWKTEYTLAFKDVSASPDDYNAYTNLSQYYINHRDYNSAELNARRSINIYPYYENYINLGVALSAEGKYPEAKDAYVSALQYGFFTNVIVDNLAQLTIVSNYSRANQQFLQTSLNAFPQDSTLWTCLAVLEDKNNDNADAKIAISNALHDGKVDQAIYEGIMNNRPFLIYYGNAIIKIP